MRIIYPLFALCGFLYLAACGGLQREPLDDVTAANMSYQQKVRADSNGLGKKNKSPVPADSSGLDTAQVQITPSDSTRLTKAELDSIQQYAADRRLLELCYAKYEVDMPPSVSGMAAFARQLASYKTRPHLFATESPYEYIFYARGQNKAQPLWLVRYDTALIDLVLFDARLTSFRDLEKQSEYTYDMMMNAGMFHPNGAPVGLFIQNGQEYEPLNTQKGRGNFYLKPNGVFFITEEGQYGVMETEAFRDSLYKNKEQRFQLATQSGPMLLIDGAIHPVFNEGSPNLNIRNGVGVVGGEVIFVLSKEPINLYDFATIFKTLGCKNALYLDGVISDMKIRGAKRPWSYTRGFGPVIASKKREAE